MTTDHDTPARRTRTMAPDHEVELAFALHAEGMGYRRIAQKLERNPITVRGWLRGRCRKRVGRQV